MTVATTASFLSAGLAASIVPIGNINPACLRIALTHGKSFPLAAAKQRRVDHMAVYRVNKNRGYTVMANWNDIIKVESTNTQKSDIIILPQSEEKTQKAGKRNVDLQ